MRFHGLGAMDFEGVAQLELDLVPGETPLEVEFETATLSGRCLDDPTGLLAQWTAETEECYTSRTFWPTTPRVASTRRACSPSGELAISRRDSWTEALRRALEVPAGKETKVELP